MSRLPCALLLAAISLSTACINVPEVEPDPPPDGGAQPTTKFTLNVSPSEDSVLQGGSRAIQVSIVRATDFTDSVTATLEQPPAGITAPPTVIPNGESTATLNIQVAASAAAGETTLTVRAASGNDFRTASLKLAIAQAGDLIVRWAAPAPEESVSYTNGALLLEATIEGGTAEAVEFHRDTQFLVRVTAPPYTYSWDTRGMTEGEFQVTARAVRGGRTFTSVSRRVVVDRTQPTVASRTPASSNAQVSARAPLEAIFSEPVRPASISQDNVEVLAHGDTRIEAGVSLSADGTTLTITPTAPIPAPSTVLVKLGTSAQPILDLAGNVVQSTSEWLFTVPVWLPVGAALSALPGATPAENAVLKLGADDHPVVAWSEFDGSAKNIHVARWNGSTWVHLGGGLSGLAGSGTHADNPDLHIDEAGRIVIAWNEATGIESYRRVFLRRWSAGNWEDLPPIPRIDNIETDGAFPKFAIMNDGSIVLYMIITAGHAIHGLKLGKDALDWVSTNVPNSRDHAFPGQPAVAVHGTSVFLSYNVLLLATERRELSVLMNHQTPLGDNLTPLLPDDATAASSIATTNTGSPLITWQTVQNNFEESELYFSRWTGSNWSPPASVSSGLTSNATPSLKVGSDNRATLAWSGISNSERVIGVARLQGATWEMISPPLSASANTSTPSLKPSLALDSANRPVVAWQEGTGTGTDVHVYRHNQ